MTVVGTQMPTTVQGPGLMNESRETAPSCCCGPSDGGHAAASCQDSRPGDSLRASRLVDKPWIDGTVATPVGDVPRVSTTLTWADRAGSWKARWGIGRMHYKVEPGLYAVGRPEADSPVFVSANYKMSFDRLRAQLNGVDGWIVVLDTRGINVWCAAGKGTFGTEEIVRRVEMDRLQEVVSHRRLVVPQLGAPGVSAHEVTRRCGFHVVYGPVRAADLPAFLRADMKATPDMRRVQFPLRDRVVLIPVELVLGAKHVLFIAASFVVLAGLGPGIYSLERAISVGVTSAALFLAVFAASVVLTPTLLPWLPGRSFSTKGVWIGLAVVLAVGGWVWAHGGMFEDGLGAAAWLFMAPAVASFVAMNFTGVSTYTSLSGVRREMRVALPVQAVCAVIGAGLWLAGRFF
jgi:hypothetical protein